MKNNSLKLRASLAILVLVGLAAFTNPQKTSKKELLCGKDSKKWVATEIIYNGNKINSKLAHVYHINGQVLEITGSRDFKSVGNWKFVDKESGIELNFNAGKEIISSKNKILSLTRTEMKVEYFKKFSENDKGMAQVTYTHSPE